MPCSMQPTSCSASTKITLVQCIVYLVKDLVKIESMSTTLDAFGAAMAHGLACLMEMEM